MARLLPWEKQLKDLRLLPNGAFSSLARSLSITTTQDFGVIVERAEGPFIWDADGKKYVDLSSGAGSANLGYAVPEIIEAVSREWFRCSGVPAQDWPTKTTILLERRLCDITPGSFEKKVFFCSSGTEAIEGAIKILHDSAPDRRTFFHFRGSFHGRTPGSLSLHGSKPIQRDGFPLALKSVYNFDFPEVGTNYGQWLDNFWAKVKAKKIDLGRVNAVFLELVQGEGGINVMDPSPLAVFLMIMRDHGIRVVADEVQTGFYRTGKLFACEYYRLEPDIICLGKSLCTGFSMGATVAKAELDFDRPGRLSNTMGGVAVSAAAALTAIDLFKELDQSLLGENINLLSMFAPEGLGLMRRWRFAAAEDRQRFIDEAKARGVFLLGSGEKNVRFMPQVNIPTQLLEETLQTLRSIDIPHL